MKHSGKFGANIYFKIESISESSRRVLSSSSVFRTLLTRILQTIQRLAIRRNLLMFLITIIPKILEFSTIQKIYLRYLPFIIQILYITVCRLIWKIIPAIQLQLERGDWITFLKTWETSLWLMLNNRVPIYSGIEPIVDVAMIILFPFPIVLLLTVCRLEEIRKRSTSNPITSIASRKTCSEEIELRWWNQSSMNTTTSRHNMANIRRLKISSKVSTIHTAVELKLTNVDRSTERRRSRVSGLQVPTNRS